MSSSFGFRWLFQPAGVSGPGPGPGPGPEPGPSTPSAPPRTVPTMLWVNETPLERFGLVLQRPERWLDSVTRPLPDSARVPGMTGGRLEPFAASSARDLVLTGVLLNVALETLQQQLAALHDAFGGLLELRWPHAPRALQRGVAGLATVEPYVPEKAFVAPDRQCWRVSLPIRCSDGAVYQRAATRVYLSTTPAVVPIRGLPVGGEIVLNGPLSGACDIDCLSPAGAILWRHALRGVSLATGDTLSLRLDAPHLLIRRTAAGGTEDVYRWRSLALSSRWQHAAPPPFGSAPLRVQLSAGTGWWTYLQSDAA